MGNWVNSGVWDNDWMGGRWGLDPELIKLFSCSTQLSMLTMLINVKMPTIVDNLTYISIIHNI